MSVGNTGISPVSTPHRSPQVINHRWPSRMRPTLTELGPEALLAIRYSFLRGYRRTSRGPPQCRRVRSVKRRQAHGVKDRSRTYIPTGNGLPPVSTPHRSRTVEKPRGDPAALCAHCYGNALAPPADGGRGGRRGPPAQIPPVLYNGLPPVGPDRRRPSLLYRNPSRDGVAGRRHSLLYCNPSCDGVAGRRHSQYIGIPTLMVSPAVQR